MAMTRLCPILCLVSIAVASLHGCTRDPATPGSGGSQQFAAEGNDTQVIQQSSATTWTADSSFYDLTGLCRAQLYASTAQSTCHIDPSSTAQAVQFADALWLMWTGRTQSARQILQELQKQGGWCVWGQAGLLELALHTENHNQLASLITEFEDSTPICELRNTMLTQHYAVVLASETADWKALDRLLGELPRRAVLESPELFSSQAKLYIATGRASDLASLFAAASSKVRESTEYLTLQAEFNALNEGVGSWSRAFHAQSNRHEDNRSLAVDAALSDLLKDSPEIVSAAADRLENIAAQSSQDVRLLMYLSIMLALHRQPVVSERVYRRIDTSGTSLQDFTAFHVLTAWNAVNRGDREQAKTRIGSALALAPRHFSANYLKALIAKRESDSEMGLEALGILLNADPYNENVRFMIKGFYEQYPSEDWKSLHLKSQQAWTMPQ